MPNDFLPFVVTRAAAPADLQDQKTNPVKLIVNIELLNSIGLIDENKEKVYKKEELLTIISRIKELISTKEYTHSEIIEGLTLCEDLLKKPTKQ